MADNKPGYSLVSGGDGGRVSGRIRRRIGEDGGNGCGFLDLSLGSIYNNASSVADDSGFAPVARALFPAAAATLADASSAVPSVDAAAATAAYAPSAPASRTPVSVLPLLFVSDGSGAVPVPMHGNITAAGDTGATTPAPAPRSKRAMALLGASSPTSAPPSSPPNRKAPRRPRGNATGRRRRSGADGDDNDADGDALAPPFPWATKTAGAHPTLAELINRGICSVEGEVCCKRCDASKTISYNIRAKFEELSGFILRNVEAMHDRAPPEWMYPALPDCDKCGQKNSLRPVIAAEKWRINWMFLLLGQTLGLCTLEQLKHFCARTRQHRTGAKDRVLYSTYMELCNQLCPGGPFDMASERKNRTRPFA